MDNYLRQNSTFTKDPILTQANLTIKDSFDSCQKFRPYPIFQSISSASSQHISITINQTHNQHLLSTSNIQNNLNDTNLNNLDQPNSWIDENELCNQDNSLFNFCEILGDLNQNSSGQKISSNNNDQDLSDTSSEIESASSSNFGLQSNHEWGRSSGYASEVSNSDEVDVIVDENDDYFARRRLRMLQRERKRLQEKAKNQELNFNNQPITIKRSENNSRKTSRSFDKNNFIYYDWTDPEDDDGGGGEGEDDDDDLDNDDDEEEGDEASDPELTPRPNPEHATNTPEMKAPSYRRRLSNSMMRPSYKMNPKKNSMQTTKAGHEDVTRRCDKKCSEDEEHGQPGRLTKCLKRSYEMDESSIQDSSISNAIKRRVLSSRSSALSSTPTSTITTGPTTRASFHSNKKITTSDQQKYKASSCLLHSSGNNSNNTNSNSPSTNQEVFSMSMIKSGAYNNSSKGDGNNNIGTTTTTTLGCNDNCNYRSEASPPPTDGRRRHLLHFIIELLNKRHNCVEWVNKTDRVFQISNPNELTRLWGQYKKNTKMTFESLSRSLRLYYAPKKLERIQGRRHQYRLLYVPSKPSSKMVPSSDVNCPSVQYKIGLSSSSTTNPSGNSPSRCNNNGVITDINNNFSNLFYPMKLPSPISTEKTASNLKTSPTSDHLTLTTKSAYPNHQQYPSNNSKFKWYNR